MLSRRPIATHNRGRISSALAGGTPGPGEDPELEVTPLTLISSANVLAWIVAESDTTVLSGSNVVAVADQTGFGEDFSGVSTPTWAASGWRGTSPTWNTNGTASYLLNSLTLPNLTLGGTNNSFYINCTFQITSLVPTGSYIFSIGLSSNTSHYLAFGTSASGNQWFFRRQMGGAAGQFFQAAAFGTADTNEHSIEIWFDGTNTWINDNGVEILPPTVSTIASGFGVMNRFALGGLVRASLGTPTACKFKELFVCDAAITEDLWGEYLQPRWHP